MGTTKSGWFEAIKKLLSSPGPPRLPQLILPDPEHPVIGPTFSDILSNTTLRVNLLPEARESTCCSTSHGLLIMVTKSSSDILVLNPLKSQQLIHLPRISEHEPGLVVRKIVLSSSPARSTFASEDWSAMAICGESRKLALYKPEDKTWKVFEESKPFYEDVIFHQGQFYAVDECGGVVVLDDYGLKELAPPWFFFGDRVYLVGSPMGLLLVVRYIQRGSDSSVYYRTTDFKVYKLETATSDWLRLRSLGDLMLFLGGNHSLCLSATEFQNCCGNCIYFTDDHVEGHVEGAVGGHDSGIFDLECRSIEPLLENEDDSQLIWPPPMWIAV